MNLSFNLHYQPIFYLHALDKPFGYEALLRPNSGVPPIEALRNAETQNLLDMWELQIFERAVDEILTRELCTVFVNLTGASFMRRDFMNQAERVLQSRGVAASRVCLEISERQVIECSFLSSAIEDWLERGFYIALDDFGAGGSNLDILLNCHLDYIKLDRLLVNGIAEDPRRQDLLNSLIAMISRESIYPIFEGIEKQEDLQWLIRQGWDAGVQGYSLGKPAPLEKGVK
jgi:EAL domain-containing protein (putative c-di-GMP-specific phosphodiesterase class I)